MIEILEPLFTEEEKQALVEEIPADRIQSMFFQQDETQEEEPEGEA